MSDQQLDIESTSGFEKWWEEYSFKPGPRIFLKGMSLEQMIFIEGIAGAAWNAALKQNAQPFFGC